MEEVELFLDFNDTIDFEQDFNVQDFNFSGEEEQTRIIKPKYKKGIKEKQLKYKYAKDMVKEIDIAAGFRAYAIVEGNFYFGDFIEALVYENCLLAKEMTISTLSLNQNNVDSLEMLLKHGYIDKLNLIVSNYYFSHERHALIPYIYRKLDYKDKFQLSVSRTHCKLCCMELDNGQKWVMHGSANLRSSGNVEQLMIEENPSLYDFNMEFQNQIIDEYKTIKKGVK